MLPYPHLIRAEVINPKLIRLTFDDDRDRAEIHTIHEVNRRYVASEKAWYVRFPYLYIEKPYVRMALDTFEHQLTLPGF